MREIKWGLSCEILSLSCFHFLLFSLQSKNQLNFIHMPAIFVGICFLDPRGPPWCRRPPDRNKNVN